MENNESLRELPTEERYKIFADYCTNNYCPISRPKTAELLKVYAKTYAPKNILEIGTAIGYSGAVMLDNCDGNLTTLEKNEDMCSLATEHFKVLGLSERVNLIKGDAGEILQNLVSENKKFDMVFLDGPKSQYIKYFEFIDKMLNKGGVLIADDVLFFGAVLDETKVNAKNKTIVKNLKLFLHEIKSNPNYQSEIFNIDDGVSISIKVKN